MARGQWGSALQEHIFRVKVSFTLGQSKCQTGFYLRDVGVNGQSAQDVAEAVQPWAQTSFRTLLASVDFVTGVDVVRLDNDEGGSVTITAGQGNVGVDAAKLVPSFMMCAISLKGELRKRYGQGRMFWPVRSDEAIQGEELSTGGRTQMQTVLTALTDEFIGNALTTELHLVNAHPALPALDPTPKRAGRPAVPASWYDVTAARINTLLSSVESRKVSVGT